MFRFFVSLKCQNLPHRIRESGGFNPLRPIPQIQKLGRQMLFNVA